MFPQIKNALHIFLLRKRYFGLITVGVTAHHLLLLQFTIKHSTGE